MSFLKLLLGILSTVFSAVVLIILAISLTIFLIFTNLQDALLMKNSLLIRECLLDNLLLINMKLLLRNSKSMQKNNVITLAEKNGGGYEWGNGWEKRKGWNYKTPYGKKPGSDLEPATNINRFEAEKFCNSIGGRLPTFEEWKLAAYTQLLKSDKFVTGQTYTYPSGDKAEGINAQGVLNYNKHVKVTSLPEGINGLVAMGGNVWEWIDNQKEKRIFNSRIFLVVWELIKLKYQEFNTSHLIFILFISVLGVFMIKKIETFMSKIKIYTTPYCPFCLKIKI